MYPAQTLENDGQDNTLEQYSPLIGVVTALIGNVLISFALNIQRYAHIRLAREQEEGKTSLFERFRKRKEKSRRDYGTQQQSDLAEERLRLNLEADAWGDGNAQDEDPAKLVRPGSSSSSISKSSTVKSPEKEATKPERKTYLKSPYWWAGIILMTVGEAGNFLAYGFAPASLVSPLGVVALVSNCIIAPCLLHERFRQRDFWGVLVAIGGTVTIVLSAKNQENKMGQDEILASIKRWEFLTYLGITILLMIILMWASPRYGSRTILIDLGLVGLFGEYTALSTKGIATLLSDTLWRVLTFPITYILALILVVTALMQIRYVNRALQRFDSTQVIPTQYVIFTISVILGSAVLYRDFESATKERIGKFFGGCALTFLGVYLITSRRAKEGGEVGKEGYDEEHEIDLRDDEQYQDETDVQQDPKHHSPGHFEPRRSTKPLAAPPRTPSHQSSQSLTRSITNSSQEFDPSLVSNPWRSEDNIPTTSSSTRPRISEPSISSPLLPSEVTRPPATPMATEPARAEGPAIVSRSKTRVGHMPLMAPLSPSFSAVVADQRRRSMRRPRLSGVKKSRSQGISKTVSEDVIGAADSPLKRAEVPEEAADEHGAAGSSKGGSVRSTLSRFFSRNGNNGKGKTASDRRQLSQSED